MILSDRDIVAALRAGRIKIRPRPNLAEQLGTSSLDLRLGKWFRVFDHAQNPVIDLRNPKTLEGITKLVKVASGRPFVLHPHEFALASTFEEIELPDDVSARIDGRSSLGRLGLVIHSTSGHVDPGFKGRLTLEVSNIGVIPILLYSGIRICQLVFERLSSPTKVPYSERKGRKYAGLTVPAESQIAKEIAQKE